MKKKNGGRLFLLLLGIAASAVALSFTRVAKAAINLQYRVTRFGIWKFNQNGKLVLRVRIRFTNITNTALHLNKVDLSAYINSVYTTNQDGSVKVQNQGDFLASLSVDELFVIEPNTSTEQDFFIEIKWEDLGKLLLFNVVDIINFIRNNNFRQMANALMQKPILIDGDVKAENMKFHITQVVQVSDDSNNN